MSRIGKKPIVVPGGVKVALSENQVSVEGPLGKLRYDLVSGITLAVEDGKILVRRADDQRQSRANQGLARALMANMVRGVHQGFQRVLEVSGVGYRAEAAGNNLVLQLGFSHKVEIPIPDQVKVEVEKNTRVTVRGVDKQAVGSFAAQIRALRDPDPYKAKGITYEGERIIRKAGKKAIS